MECLLYAFDIHGIIYQMQSKLEVGAEIRPGNCALHLASADTALPFCRCFLCIDRAEASATLLLNILIACTGPELDEPDLCCCTGHNCYRCGLAVGSLTMFK